MFLLQAMSPMIVFPWAALLPALLLAVLYRRRGTRMALAAAWAWGLYALYETLMYYRILCSGECNIRVDLLLLYPLRLPVRIAPAPVPVRTSRTFPGFRPSAFFRATP